MRHFSREFKDWTLKDREHLTITLIESKGKDLDDLLCNGTVFLEDWHGNEGPQISIGDLPSYQYDAVVDMFAEFLAESQEVS